MTEVPAEHAAPQPNPTLTVAALSVSFATDAGAVDAVTEVSFEVFPGEVLAIVGESGSGKSVCARTALGLLPDTARVRGAVLLGDRPTTAMSEKQLTAIRGGRIAMVFQEPGAALDPLFTVGFQIAEAIRAHGGATRAAARARAIELLRTVGLPDPEHRVDFYPHQLSGGQKQRVMIAIAIACEPEVIIADEPTTALDVTVQAEILELLRDLRDRIGAAIVLITHNMGVVADLADRVVVMRYGRVVETATVHDLFATPRAQYTRDLLAAVPRMHTGAPASAATGQPPPGDVAMPHTPTAASASIVAEQLPSGDVAMPHTPTAASASIVAEQLPPGDVAMPHTPTSAFTSVVPEQLPPPDPDAPVLTVADLVVEFPGSFGRRPFRAVDRVSLRLARGETLGLVGESGSGKTTIGRCVAALQRPTSGTIRMLGTELTGLSERRLRPLRKRLGFVFQDPATSLNPRLTVGRCVAEPLIVHRAANGPALRTRVRQLLDAVQLPAGTENRYPHELSGGQRQRASLARALVLNPDLLIADEPTSALDVSVQATVLELFAQLQGEFGWACLFISHDLAVVDQLAARIMVLRNGSVVEQGSADEILRHPAEEYTRRLVAAVPVPDPVEQRRRRIAAIGE